MTSVQFQKDNERGLEGQHYVRDMFCSWGCTVEEAPDSFFPEWDLKVNGKTVEVKYDLLSATTGKVYLELEALNHSRADLLAIVVDNPRTVYIAPLPQVRDFALQYPFKVKGGEFKQPAALVPRSIFLDRLKPQILTTQPNGRTNILAKDN
jgi:hypothetical protein